MSELDADQRLGGERATFLEDRGQVRVLTSLRVSMRTSALRFLRAATAFAPFKPCSTDAAHGGCVPAARRQVRRLGLAVPTRRGKALASSAGVRHSTWVRAAGCSGLRGGPHRRTGLRRGGRFRTVY